jgi:hypothetical protein
MVVHSCLVFLRFLRTFFLGLPLALFAFLGLPLPLAFATSTGLVSCMRHVSGGPVSGTLRSGVEGAESSSEMTITSFCISWRFGKIVSKKKQAHE